MERHLAVSNTAASCASQPSGFDSRNPFRLWRVCLEHLRKGDSNPRVASGSEPANVAPYQYLLMLDSGALRLHQTSKLTNGLLMSRTPKQMKRYREHRLELILLGMCIAKDGDREKVLSSVSRENLSSPLIAKCMEAVETLDAEDVAVARQVFSEWGVKVGGSVSQSLIAAVNLNNARRQLSKAVEEATAGNCILINQALEEVETCLHELKEMQKVQSENGVAT